MTLLRSLTEAARAVSPRHRRWQRLLDEMTLDPATLPGPLNPPGDQDFIICGLPRSGTSLAAAILHQPPHIVTVMEPWDGMRLPPRQLFASLRGEIAETGRLRRGKLDVARLDDDGEVRWRSEGAPVPLEVVDDYLVGVKWPAFWRYLEFLPDTRFVVCLRDPFQTVASFKRVGGRLGEGLDYDIAFDQTMNDELSAATSDVAVRRALLYEYIASRVTPFLGRSNVLAVRYERWFSDADALIAELEAFFDVPLEKTVQVRSPRTDDSALPSRERTLIRQLCQSAEAVGYVV